MEIAKFRIVILCSHTGDCKCLTAIYWLHFYSEYGDSRFLQNVGNHLHDLKTSQPRKLPAKLSTLKISVPLMNNFSIHKILNSVEITIIICTFLLVRSDKYLLSLCSFSFNKVCTTNRSWTLVWSIFSLFYTIK